MAVNDLNIDQTTDKDYILLTIKDLVPGQTYPVQFRWKHSDGTFGGWSPARTITPPIESLPGAPNVTVSGATPGTIIVSWDGKDLAGNTMIGIKEIDVYLSGSPFNSSVPAIVLSKAGTFAQTAPAGQYGVTAYAVTSRNTLSEPRIISGGVEVTAIGTIVQAPTLPTGLTAASAPFALTVNWDGSYSSNTTFSGFKSIDIYATSNASLGSSTTTGFTTANIVGNLTVDKKTNRINIGLDNLRQAMSLSTNATAYTTDTYLYYVAVNQNNEQYKVGGTVTYTRINSTALRPTQANYIDLASGIISVENLVAGSGNFASWLRTGSSSGGARIELSAITDFTNSGYTVQKGLVAYSSANTEIFNLDIDAGTLTINGSGTFTGDLSAGSGDSIFKSDSNGIYLGSGSWSGAASTFRVSRSGYLTAAYGSIGGISIGANSIGNAYDTFTLSSSGLRLGSESGSTSNIYITPSGIYHRNGTTNSGRLTIDSSTGYTTILAGTPGGSRVIFDNDGLRAYSGSTKTIDINSGGSAFFSGSIDASAITGSSFVAESGTKKTTISNNATISIVDTGSDWTGGGALSITSGAKTLYLGSRSVSFDGASMIFTDGGLGGYAENDLVIASGSNTIHLGGYSESGYVQANKHLNSLIGTISAGSTSTTPSDKVTGVFMNAGGTIVSRRLDGIPAWFGRWGTAATVEAVRFMFSANQNAGSMSDAGGININSAGNPAFRSLSDYRLKEDIEDYSDGLNRINLTKVRSFVMKSDKDIPQVGFVAHELAEAFPEFVQGEKDGVDEEGNPEYQSIMTTNLIPHIVSAIKELSASIDLINQRLDALEG